jgi:hypothetical protein
MLVLSLNRYILIPPGIYRACRFFKSMSLWNAAYLRIFRVCVKVCCFFLSELCILGKVIMCCSCMYTHIPSIFLNLFSCNSFVHCPILLALDQHPTSPSRRHVVFTAAQRCPPHPFLDKWLQVILAITISLHCPCTERLLLIQVQGRS